MRAHKALSSDKSGSIRRRTAWLSLASMVLFLGACSEPHETPSKAETTPTWPFPAARRVAVVPILNFTGETTLDPVKAADLLALELGQMQGVTVIPVNRVLAALARSGSPYVRSPAHAIELCRAVGADAVLITGVTRYDPYVPMTIALTMELYLLPTQEKGQAAQLAAAARPVAQLQHVFDASQSATEHRVHAFGDRHRHDVGSYGWRRYLVTQEGYLRFCFSEGLEILFGGESNQMRVVEITEG